MRLVATICSTDWKGRPDHKIQTIAEVPTIGAAVLAMAIDVFRFMVSDLLDDEEENSDECPEDWDRNTRQQELEAVDPAKIAEDWEIDSERFEMRGDYKHREFVWKCDGDTSTLVYHLLDDNFEPVPGF